MLHKKIDIPKEYFYQIMTKLGSISSSIEFEDLNTNELESSKVHSSIINRCDEVETIFTHLDEVINDQLGLKIDLYENYKDFKKHLDYELKNSQEVIKEKNYFDIIQNIMSEEELKIKLQYNLNKQQINSFINLLEKKYIFEKMVELFEGNIINDYGKNEELKNDYNEFSEDEENSLFKIPIKYLCGMCDTENVMKIRRIIFRAGKGLGVVSFYFPNINDDYKDLIINEKKYFAKKQIFLILATSQIILDKISKNLEIFFLDTYKIVNASKVKKELEVLNSEISYQKDIIRKLKKSFYDMIISKIEPTIIEGKMYKGLYSLYRTFSKREKYIYQNLNKCIDHNMFYVGDVWIPQIAYNNLMYELNELINEREDIALPVFHESENINAKVRTYFKKDDFVYPFQLIVNTYGIPRYKEANPGLFTIISFPFLFGIMFGDIGHGLLLISFAFYIEYNYYKIYHSDSLLKEALRYRYIFLLLGFFSFFCGLIYNDLMAIPISIFNSCYTNQKDDKIASKKENCVYPFGMDPKWYSSTNELTFTNSFKMKLSVIVGVIQMTLGIILRGLNNLYFHDYAGFFFEFIPQIIFMLLLFGYMIALIYIKWSTDYTGNTQNAPSIITILMNLALKNGSVEGKPVWTTVENEEKANQIFFYISIICIPIILLPKPIIRIIQMQKLKNKIEEENIISEKGIINDNIDNKDEIEPFLDKDTLKKAELAYDSEKFEFLKKSKIQRIEKEEYPSDIFVHQIIETIEFVLGCVSNTASYLRLWALSLAHSQLSKVFFEKSLLLVAVHGNFVFVILAYFLFINITFTVLMGMDLLEAFLHTLRLHWVEFQNKFYYADGIEFSPFSFEDLLDNDK